MKTTQNKKAREIGTQGINSGFILDAFGSKYFITSRIALITH